MTGIKTTHAGSLPRPEVLVHMMWDRLDGKNVDEAAFEACVHTAVEEVVARQRTIGLDVISDGEMGKSAFHTYVAERIAGFSVCESTYWEAADLAEFPDLVTDTNLSHLPFLCCTGPLSYVGQAELERELVTFREAVGRADAAGHFVSAVTPGTVAMNMPNDHYGSYEEYMHAIAAALKTEYDAIIAAGFTLQLDAPDLALAGHLTVHRTALPPFPEHLRTAVDAINTATADIPPDRLRLHVCWGNYVGPHHRDTPIESILPTALTARPRMLSFEAANPRHAHEWTAFAELALPDDLVLIPGVIDTKSLHVEHPRLVAQRLEQFVSLVGRERVLAGTDCGFSTAVGAGTVPPSIAWAKLAALVEGAALM
jgi:5-methyltetrahydropteroyltriglutamate--homocysteine methyltransferase